MEKHGNLVCIDENPKAFFIKEKTKFLLICAIAQFAKVAYMHTQVRCLERAPYCSLEEQQIVVSVP